LSDYKPKLIEVALPLQDINREAAREKSIRHGHPSTLHLWWARRPLAAARAVIWASLVDDPSSDETLTFEEQEKERERLFNILRDLVVWENSNDPNVLATARAEIERCFPDGTPPVVDPFAGGGAIPLEAQRLGLPALSGDLNPVAVLIQKAMVEIPPRFADMPPVSTAKDARLYAWSGSEGIAADVEHYAEWVRSEALRRIGHLYPDVPGPNGERETAIAWIWARTVKSPNPAFAHVDVPLTSTFMLSTKKGKEAYIEPLINNGAYRFTVKVDKPLDLEAAKKGTKLSRGANFKCIMSGTAINNSYIKGESMAGRMNDRLMAIVAEGYRQRIYISPSKEHEMVAYQSTPFWKPDQEMNRDTRDLVSGRGYGFFTWADLFTSRQLVALTTFSDLVGEARERIHRDAIIAGLSDDGNPLNGGGTGASAYADAVGVYLGFSVDKGANYWSSLCAWHQTRDGIVSTFGRQALPMVWDYAEANPFSDSSGNIMLGVKQASKMLDSLGIGLEGVTSQSDAATQFISSNKVISTDPPYYDNIGYADLSDFFYLWLRRSLKPAFPDLFATLAVPKAEELVATPYRHGTKGKAEMFFLDGMTRAIQRLAEQTHSAFPSTIYYAFKQSESDGLNGTASTGWETFLEAVIKSGFAITGTWPFRTEYTGNLKKKISALASSIVIVCRKRSSNAPTATRREFVTELKQELPRALRLLQAGNIAPVDLAQASIGPGMAAFTRYAKVLDAEGDAMTVRNALTLINQILDEVLAEQEGEMDGDTRWAVAWFEQYGMGEAPYGAAETLCNAKNTSMRGLVEAGIVHSKGGRVHLLRRDELDPGWDPQKDKRLTVWEATHHLIRKLENEGEEPAAELIQKLGGVAEQARDLAYRLFQVCERKKWASDALIYNSLVIAWPELTRRASRRLPSAQQEQDLF